MKKALFIYNPKAGRAGIVEHLSDVIDIFTKNGFEITIHPTQCQGDGEVCAANREDIYDRIICSGGDGTLDEIVTGVMRSGKMIPIGYIPAGSTNDFSRSINIPRDMLKAAEIATTGQAFKCDIGKFNDRFFVYVAAFGMFTDVTYETDQTIKNKFGYVAYVMSGIKSFQHIKPIPLKILYDDKVIEDKFLIGMVSNSTSVGGVKALPGPDVDLTDGEFEALLVKFPEDIFQLNAILPAIIDRNNKSDCVISFKCSSIKIISEEPIPWTLDGEFGGNVKEADISNVNKTAEFIIP